MTSTKLTSAKAVAAGIGLTLTSLTTALATVQLVLSDDAVDFAEYGTLTTAAVTLVASIYAVWRTPNKVVTTYARGRTASEDEHGY